MTGRIITEGRSLRLEGEIDVANATDLAEAIREACAGGSDVAIDMSGLSFIDSSGLHALHQAIASQDGAKLVLVDVPANILRIMGILGMDRLREISFRSRAG
jgi:anti-sigma B factor antagonist